MEEKDKEKQPLKNTTINSKRLANELYKSAKNHTNFCRQ
jgi:hypothetical protein|nr:MAG TPA: hypothetical protein [Caudoviricetes sp.]